MLKRALAVAILGLAVVVPGRRAPAQDGLPAFDTDAFCRGEAVGKADPEIAVMICTDMETGSRDQARTAWTAASPENRQACASQAGGAAGGSYLTLLGCLEARGQGQQAPRP